MVTPGTAAPELSVARPVRVARPVCAETVSGTSRQRTRHDSTNDRVTRTMAGGSFMAPTRLRERRCGRERRAEMVRPLTLLSTPERYQRRPTKRRTGLDSVVSPPWRVANYVPIGAASMTAVIV